MHFIMSAINDLDEEKEYEEDIVRCCVKNDIQPYLFEPAINADTAVEYSSSDESDNETNSERIGNVKWCSCGRCKEQSTGLESCCCRDYSPVNSKCEEFPPNGLKCITDHPGFHSNCLDPYVLETSFYEFCEEQGPMGNDQPIHKVYRYIAYRRFVRWVWRRLGKKKRLPLPVCARDKIRDNWPDESYCGFKYPKSD